MAKQNRKITSKITPINIGIFLALIVLSFTVGYLVNKTSPVRDASAQGSPPNGPLAGVKPVVGTLTVPAGGTTPCTTTSPTYDPDLQGCAISQVPLANPPVSTDCEWNMADPTNGIFNGVWRDCFTNKSDANNLSILQNGGVAGLNVLWKNGNLELFVSNGGGT